MAGILDYDYLGHQTFYATYYGVGDAHRLLPPDLDVIFISCYTQVSPIAYALGVLYRKAGTRTVIDGPHAKAFPVDCLRFFDLVVQECDQSLIADILAGHFDPGALISIAQPFDDVPTVEERMPEIRASAFFWGKRPLALSTIPMLASMGCPYQCNFCIDWNTPVTTLKHYDPVTYYEKLIELFSYASSSSMLQRRVQSTSHGRIKLIHWARTASTRASMNSYRRILQALRSDSQFRAFHEGRSAVLPEFYHHMYERMLKQYAELLCRADRVPNLERNLKPSNSAKKASVA